MKNGELLYTAIASSHHVPVKQRLISWKQLTKYLSEPKVGKKEGSGFVAANIDDGRRLSDRVKSISFLVYDLDNKGDIVGINELEAIIRENGYKAIIHSTYNHTPEKPRYRLILNISEPLLPAEHKRVLLKVAGQLGIAGAIDQNATDVSRFFYRPRFPANQKDNYVFKSIDGAAIDIPAMRSIDGALVDIPSIRSIPSGKVIALKPLQKIDRTIAVLAGLGDWPETPEHIEKVRKMLLSVPPSCGRDDWKTIIWSVLSLDWDVGEELITDWSKTSEEHWGGDDVSAIARVDLAGVIDDYDYTAGIGIGTLWHHAEANGWKHRPAEIVEDTEGDKTPPRFNILSPSDLYNLPPMEWLVKGILPTKGVAAIYGAPGSGKTFLALDLALAISEGLPKWFNREIQQREVVYLALEGTMGIGKRIKAWEKHNETPATKLKLILDSFNLKNLLDVEVLVESIRQVVGCGCVVIIDTLNQASPGSDENSSVDMGLLLAATKTIYLALDGLVLLVHHSGKNAQNGLRGHSSMNGAMDTVMLVQKQKFAHVWSIDKVKDADGSVKESFDLVSCNVDKDAGGLPETSCAVEPVDSILSMFDKKPAGKHQKPVHLALEVELKKCERLTYDEALDKAKAALEYVPSKNRAGRAKTALTGLIDAGYLIEDERGVLLPESSNHAS